METLKIDTQESIIEFKVKHLVIATVTGRFDNFDGTIETDGTPVNTKIDFELQTDSLKTNIDARDKHLKSSEFLDSKTYPKITFKSDYVKSTKGNIIMVRGKLTIKGKTKIITLRGSDEDGLLLNCDIKRSEFGLELPAQSYVSDDIKLTIKTKFGIRK